MHVIIDKLDFKKENDFVIGERYILKVDDIVIVEKASSFKSSITDFKKYIKPNLIKLGFDEGSESHTNIHMVRSRRNLNENIEIVDFLKDFRII